MTRCGWDQVHKGSCLSTDNWHMVFDRKLTKADWERYSAIVNSADTGTWNADAEDWDPQRCADVIRTIRPKAMMVTLEYKSDT